MSVENLLRRADAARSLVARGELEAMAALEVVMFPSPELERLEVPQDTPERSDDPNDVQPEAGS